MTMRIAKEADPWRLVRRKSIGSSGSTGSAWSFEGDHDEVVAGGILGHQHQIQGIAGKIALITMTLGRLRLGSKSR
jgi:hypothetical protein